MQPVCRRTLQQDEDVELPRLEHVRASCGSCTFLSCGPWRLKREEKEGEPPARAARWHRSGAAHVACVGRGLSTTRGARACVDKSSKQRPSLSGSWQQGHSAAYNTPFLIQVVCKGSIGPGPEIAADNGSGKATLARGVPGPVEGFPSGVDSNLEAFSYNPAHSSFAASPFPAAAIPMMRIGGSSRTEPNYCRQTNIGRVKLTCLTTV